MGTRQAWLIGDHVAVADSDGADWQRRVREAKLNGTSPDRLLSADQRRERQALVTAAEIAQLREARDAQDGQRRADSAAALQSLSRQLAEPFDWEQELTESPGYQRRSKGLYD